MGEENQPIGRRRTDRRWPDEAGRQRGEQKLTLQEFEDALREVLFQIDDRSEDGGEPEVATLEDRGLLTTDRGFVVTTSDGSEFQLTLVQRR